MKLLNKTTCPSPGNNGGRTSNANIWIAGNGKIIISPRALRLLNLSVNDVYELIHDEALYIIKSAKTNPAAYRVGVGGCSCAKGLRNELNLMFNLKPNLNYKWEISETITKSFLDGGIIGYQLFNPQPTFKK